MKTIVTATPFQGNYGQNSNMNEESLIVVSIGTGTAELQVSTPDGWLTIKTYSADTAEGFSFRVNVLFQFVITGDSKVYMN